MSRKNRKTKIEKKSSIKQTNFISRITTILSNPISETNSSKRFYLATFGVIIVLAALLRLYSVGELPLNEDETYTLTAAKRLITGTGSPNDASPLFIVLQYIFFLLFGITETAGRIPSVIFGIASIAVTFYFIKKFINIQTAVIISIILGFSFFNVFMSRLARPYTALQLSYIVLTWTFLSINNSIRFSDISIFEGIKHFFISKNFLFLIIVFFISIKIHPWTALFVISILFYFIFNMISLSIKKEYNQEFKINLILGSSLFSFLLIIYAILQFQLFPELFKGMQVEAFGMDIKRTYEFLKEDIFKGVVHYFKLFYYDFNYLWIFSIIGFISSFIIIKDRRILLLLHAIVISHIILLGFLINVLQQRYFFPAYTFYLIYAAIGFFALYKIITHLRLFTKNSLVKKVAFLLISISILAMLPFGKYDNLYSLNMYRNIYIDENIGEYSFYPYRTACKYVSENIKPGEDVVCVMPRIAEFYIDRDIYTLRQVRFNREKLNTSDVLVEDTTIYPNSMRNHRSFLNFLETHKSGWLIADARINTALSKETRDFILNHFDFSFLGSNPLTTMLVAHWDSTVLKKEPQYFWLFHKEAQSVDLPYKLNIDPDQEIMISIVYSGIEKEKEASCTIGGISSWIPPNRNLDKSDTADWVMKADGLVKTGFVNFSYNPNCRDSLEGFILHNIVTFLGSRK